jgi:Tol biopolymer transport system component
MTVTLHGHQTGRQIAFGSARDDERVTVIYIMNVDGNNLRKLTNDPNLSCSSADWQKGKGKSY